MVILKNELNTLKTTELWILRFSHNEIIRIKQSIYIDGHNNLFNFLELHTLCKFVYQIVRNNL